MHPRTGRNTTCSPNCPAVHRNAMFTPELSCGYPGAFPYTAVCRSYYTVTEFAVNNHILYTEWQFCFLSSNLILFFFIFIILTLIFFLNLHYLVPVQPLNKNSASRHICFFIFKGMLLIFHHLIKFPVGIWYILFIKLAEVFVMNHL